MEKYLKEKNVFSWLKVLYDSYSNPLSMPQQEELDDLDAIWKDAMVRAESICRKFRMGKVSWTPEYEFKEELDDLDAIRKDAMVRAESKCRKFRMGKVSWTPEYELITQEI